MLRFAACLAFLFSSLLCAAEVSLGVAVSDGSFRLNRADVRGNATLLDGAEVETLGDASQLQLTNGAKVELAAWSRVEVRQDRVVMERGYGEMTLPAGFAVEARGLEFSAQGKSAHAVMSLMKDKSVQVAANSGALRVRNAAGMLVSRIEPGMALEFEPQVTGQAVPSTVIGCLLKKGDNFVVYDQLNRIVVQLRGSGFEREWGNRVQVNGVARATAQPAAANVQVLEVSSMTRIEQGGCAEIAQAIEAQLPAGQAPAAGTPAGTTTAPPPPGSSGGGMSAGTKVAIVAVVAGGGGAAAYFATQKDKSRSN